MEKKRARGYTNEWFRKMTYMYAAVLLIVGLLACFFAYSKEKDKIISRIEQVMGDINHEYKNCTENFWRLYMPIFENRSSVYVGLKRYFTAEDKAVLTPVEKKELIDALQAIMGNDSRIKWIGVYSGKEEVNYLLFAGENVLTEMSDGFPFIDDMENKGNTMEIYGSRLVPFNGGTIRSFALCGGTPTDMRGGKIIVGYAVDNIDAAYTRTEELEDVRFYILNNKGIIYDSFGEYSLEYDFTWKDAGVMQNQDRERVYVCKMENTGNNYTVFCEVSWIDMVMNNHSYTPYIVAIVLLFWGGAVFLNHLMGREIAEKIAAIQLGLKKIGDNQLDYRIPVADVPTDEFDNIGRCINEVAIRLQDNIDKVYLSKLKQKEAELSELQAKFDPHFLYNTLEVIRGKVYEKGDDETADIIIKLAQIFRSFIGSERFVLIQEEMEFCNLYLSLLRYRYDNRVKIIYDIDSEILQYGIIRNLLQPILENYFVHGFSSDKRNNRLVIRGKLIDENYVRFQIRDNGLGISDERLKSLKEQLDTIEVGSKSSYGLKNVNKRIKIFYGAECGVTIDTNDDGGATIEVNILKLTCREHEARMYDDVKM